MGKPENKLLEIKKRMEEVIDRMYEHGEGEATIKFKIFPEKKKRDTVIYAGVIYRFEEKTFDIIVVDKDKDSK